ncbi:MAG TPA: hypothetical protein VFT37_08030 [Telluria sp.]|nr:hypothetical protein [Telluria sp.]
MAKVNEDIEFRKGFSGIRNGVLAAGLAEMTDDELAAWQAAWRPGVAQYILAEKEWQRRMLAHEFGLNRRLAEYAAKWQRFAAYIGVAGTVVGAILGLVSGSVFQSSPSPAMPKKVSSAHGGKVEMAIKNDGSHLREML